MKDRIRLSKAFVVTVGRVRGGAAGPGKNALSPLENRANTIPINGETYKGFLDETSRRLQMLAEALPDALNRKTFSYEVSLPAFFRCSGDGGRILTGRHDTQEPRFFYNDLRTLTGMSRLIQMAQAADVNLEVSLTDVTGSAQVKPLAEAFRDKEKSEYYDALRVSINIDEPFNGEKFPRHAPAARPRPRLALVRARDTRG